MEVTKALYISQEINPYLNPTVMSELCRSLPQGMIERGAEVRTFMPKYGCINERRNQLHEVIRLSGLNISIDDNDHPLIIKVATLQPSRLQVYFIDNDDFFHHHASQELEIVEYADDNDERMIFFTMGVIETVRKLRWFPSIVHCTGWITALCPMVIKAKYQDDPAFKNGKIVFSLFDDAFEGTLDERMVEKLKMDGYTDDMLASLLSGPVNHKMLCKLGIDHSDAIVQATENIDPELIEYAKASGKPFLPFPGLDNVDAYAQFYESL